MSYGCVGTNWPGSPALGTPQQPPSVSYQVPPGSTSYSYATSPVQMPVASTVQYSESAAVSSYNAPAATYAAPQYSSYNIPVATGAAPALSTSTHDVRQRRATVLPPTVGVPSPQVYSGPFPATPSSVQMPPSQFNFKSDVDEVYEQIDRDQDGRLSYQEMQAATAEFEQKILELLEGQKQMQADMERMKEQVNGNYRELEELRKLASMSSPGPCATGSHGHDAHHHGAAPAQVAAPVVQYSAPPAHTGPPPGYPQAAPAARAAPPPAPAAHAPPTATKATPSNLKYEDHYQIFGGAFSSMPGKGILW